MSILSEIAAMTQGFSGTFGLWTRCVETGETLIWNAADSFHPASTIKVPILYEVVRTADLESRLTVKPGDLVGGSGVLKDLVPGESLTVRNLAALMIIISDNTATNMLIDLVGRKRINETMADLGYPEVRLENKLMLPRPGGPYNRATPAALGQFLERVARHELLTPTACETMLEIMGRQQYRNHITRFLTEVEEESVTIHSKSGEVTGARNELAYVKGSARSYVICMMSKGCTDPREHPDNEGSLFLPRVAQKVHRHFMG